ncbi:hypothetical protein [Halopiger goleimassiliensis]|uniref:hypothetical protein n=1 Tax=Halopiger goleimassiliensis TaxID=1293048 RepID=UPI0012B5B111|nr:hypothetical protein [Halopiger goleimassiliensis]
MVLEVLLSCHLAYFFFLKAFCYLSILPAALAVSLDDSALIFIGIRREVNRVYGVRAIRTVSVSVILVVVDVGLVGVLLDQTDAVDRLPLGPVVAVDDPLLDDEDPPALPVISLGVGVGRGEIVVRRDASLNLELLLVPDRVEQLWPIVGTLSLRVRYSVSSEFGVFAWCHE